MAIWKVTAKRKFDSGVVSFSPGMSVEIQTNTLSTSFWTQAVIPQGNRGAFRIRIRIEMPGIKV